MTQLRLSKIHHVALIVSDYEKSKFFYSELLGMKILRENFRNDRNSFKLDLQLPIWALGKHLVQHAPF